jgi:anaerobic magnesium-protoporphyrin IX monomethyl ester cyclase
MKNKLDLLIIKPGNPKKIYGNLSNSFAAVEPPVLGGLVAGFIREKGYSVKIIDMETEGMDAEMVANRIFEIKPLLVNIVVAGPNPSASSTPLMGVTREVLNSINERNLNVKTILTGIHPSALPERTLREEKTDFVGKGESFYTALYLLEALKFNKNIEKQKIDGLWFLNEEGDLISNGWGKLVENLDEIPFIAWDLLDMKKYRSHNWHCFDDFNQRSPYAVIYTSLGCPYNCSYCNIRTLYDGKPGIRFRSPENVIKEIDLLVKSYNVKTIKFLDELFAINEERVDRICDLLIQRNYNLNIWAYARINTVNEKMLRKMKKAGINWLCYGIESGSKKVRTGVSKLGFEQDTIGKVVKMTKDAGIYILGNFIFGLPDDNLETMKETFNMAKELKCEYVNFYATMAYPGSKLYEDALRGGIKLPESWLGFAQLNEETLPLPTKHISGEEVLRFRDKAFKEYFANPDYLEMIEEKFGKDIVSHINEMLKHEINRKFI